VRGSGAAPVAELRPLTPFDLSRPAGTSHGSPLTPPVVGTVGAAVESARRVLEGAGVADPRREAAELYAALVEGASGAAWLERDAPLGAAASARLLEAARGRAAGWPQAYAAGRANFRGWWLAVDRRVLIPRPETEGLVDVVLAWVRDAGLAAPRVADAGTGSGAIAVALARESPARVVATDAAPGALAVARANVAAHGVAARVTLARGRWLRPFRGATVDAVVSNPPYVATGEWERLEAGVKDFEPREALDAGPDGLDATRELVSEAWDALGPGGLLALELDARRARASAELAATAGFASCVVLEDLSGRPRYLRARRPVDGRH
jgi:release factor glutamine methyltransferase